MNPNNQNGQLNQFKPANPLSLILVGIILIVLIVAAGYILSLLQSPNSEGPAYYKRNKNSQQKIYQKENLNQTTSTPSSQLNEPSTQKRTLKYPDTSKWKTYKSTYPEKFSFKYPPNFTLKVDRDEKFSTGWDNEALIGYQFKFNVETDGEYGNGFQMILENTKGKTIKQYNDDLNKKDPSLGMTVDIGPVVNNAAEQALTCITGVGVHCGKTFRYGNTFYDFGYPQDTGYQEDESIWSYIDLVWSTWHFGE